MLLPKENGKHGCGGYGVGRRPRRFRVAGGAPRSRDDTQAGDGPFRLAGARVILLTDAVEQLDARLLGLPERHGVPAALRLDDLRPTPTPPVMSRPAPPRREVDQRSRRIVVAPMKRVSRGAMRALEAPRPPRLCLVLSRKRWRIHRRADETTR